MRNIVILAGLFLFTNFISAQENEAPNKCALNMSLFNEAAKNKQYADAIGPWKEAYNECPDGSLAIYQRGRDILSWQLDQLEKTDDDAAYQETFDLLMEMYDNRIKYYGSDPRYPTPWILGLKGLDYIKYVKNDNQKRQAYEWFEQSIDGMGDKADLNVLSQFVVISTNIYKAEPDHAAKYVEDFLKVNDILAGRIADPANKNAATAEKIKESLDMIFAQSGAADCTTLDNIYGSKIAENQENLDYLKKVMVFYRMVDCTDSEVFFAATEAAHKIEPSSESANGYAQMSYKKGDFTTAIQYYDEATELEQDLLEKAEYQFKIAQIYYSELTNYVRARQYARKSLEYNPKNGKAYLLIGLMYANSKGIYDDSVLAKSVYWVAVDKFNQAKQADPSLAEDANKMVRTYSTYFPTKEEVFFHKDLEEGKTFTVGGWIGESTTIRVAK